MNKDILVMIELQRHWDKLLSAKQEIDRAGNAITYWKNRLAEKARTSEELAESIRKLKSYIRDHEVDLNAKEQQIAKLESRKLAVKTEKELNAVEHELETLVQEKNRLEEELINRMDELSGKEESLASLKREIEQMQMQSEKDIASLKAVIEEQERSASQTESAFDREMEGLTREYQSKFKKLAGTKDGRALVPLDGATCSGCHFEVPIQIALEVAKNEKIFNCTNCGRFIYKKLT